MVSDTFSINGEISPSKNTGFVISYLIIHEEFNNWHQTRQHGY
jgi:hypothetical protein